MKASLFSLVAAWWLFSAGIVFSQEASWLRYPAISPDGSTIAFSYKGDIYKVSASGGTAIPLTISDSYEFLPVWSHDGKSIAFASDRYGNFDVFVMPSSGGEGRRLTYHSGGEYPSDFSKDDKHVIFSGVRQDLHTNVQFPSGVMAELYAVPVMGGRVSLVLTTPAHDARYSPDGNMLIFHDRKGYENDWRKHHTSAVTRDIWVYDLKKNSYRQLSSFNGEDRNPVFASNNRDFYYLSEESGSFNIHASSLDNPTVNRQITRFGRHPVRFLTTSTDNTLCFSYHGEIYTMVPGEKANKVGVVIPYDGRENLQENVPVNSGFTEATLSPNGKEFAYVFRGEIFVSSLEEGTTKRITSTPFQERSVSFSPDGRTLLYAAEVENNWNLYTTSIAREEEPYFFTSTILKDEKLLATAAEEFQPSYSPDGKKVAYWHDRTTLKVLDLDSKKTHTVLDAKYNYSYSDGDMWHQWSPDSKWLLVQYGPEGRTFWPEAGLVDASGKEPLRNLTKSGYIDAMPQWSRDGSMMTWMSTREGTRGENGWMTSGDIYAMFFTKKAFDRYQLSKEELELVKEMDKKEEERRKKEEESAKKDEEADKKGTKEAVANLEFDWDGLTDRKARLTVHTLQRGGDGLLSKDNEKLFYMTRMEGGADLWVTDLRSKETKQLAKIGANNVSMEMSADGEFLLILADGRPMKVGVKDGSAKPLKTKGEMVLDREAERAYIFDHAWRQVREKFYLEDLHGVDWEFYYNAYQPFLGHINNNYDFAEMLSEMLGELNASHTGSGYRNRVPNADETSSLGVLYDYGHSGAGLLIAEVLQGGPLDRHGIRAKAGHIIEKVDGEEITTSIDFYQLLNRKSGKNVLLSVYDPAKKERWEEVVQPVSLGAENQLLYERWVRTRRAEVERLSKGRLGYVHVRGMNDPSMRTVYEDALGKHLDAEALIVDTRFNGGGNLHDVLSDFLNGKKYMDIIPHGQYIGSQPWMRWTKPSIVVMGESNYSDAHLFPVAYKIKEIGKTLGMPVPGTGTFVWWETQIDPTIFFGVPMGGWRPIGDKQFLENNQLEPDIRVPNEPGEMAKGRDQQIEAAVEEMLRE